MIQQEYLRLEEIYHQTACVDIRISTSRWTLMEACLEVPVSLTQVSKVWTSIIIWGLACLIPLEWAWGTAIQILSWEAQVLKITKICVANRCLVGLSWRRRLKLEVTRTIFKTTPTLVCNRKLETKVSTPLVLLNHLRNQKSLIN